ncbi:MAG: FimV/HubP family polar landmark protein [Burkholderiales bacterium]
MVKSTKNNTAQIKKIVAAVAISLSAAFVSPVVHAAGLGKLNVLSSLGQPLQAEVDLVSLQKGELESIVARVASPDAFRDAGLEYAASLTNVKFAVEKRSSGQPYLRISTIQPVNEPIIDLLIDLTWSSGRLLREYPILLDPPGFAANKTATAPVVSAPVSQAPVVAAAPPAPVITYAQPPAPVQQAPAQPVAAPVPAPAPVPVAQAPAPAPIPAPAPAPARAPVAASGATYGPVKPGETLYSIAQQNKPDSVSIDQMLVGLYRQNKDAFLNNNMNLLKKGKILKMPSQEEAAAIATAQATREVRVQTANWSAYRQKLAEAVTQSPAKAQQSAGQSAGGKIGSTAVDAAAKDAGKDVVKLSKGDAPDGKDASAKPGAKADQAKIASLQEEITRRDNALKEANSRVKDLEKTVADMNKLLALKNSALAQAGKQPDVKLVDPKAPVKPGDAKPVEPKAAEPKPADPKLAAKPADVKPAEPKAAEPKVAAKTEPAKPAESKPAAPKPAETKPAEPKPVVMAAPEPAEKSIMDTVFDNIVPILGGTAALGALGAGLLFFRRKKSNRTLAELDEATAESLATDLRPVSQGAPTAGVVDTSGDSSFLTDFDKTGPGVIDTEEVDPVAEADVYMAYGRDQQAEEILKEAMAKDSERHEIPMKLLDIYSNRGSKGAFENVAKELHNSLGEGHPIWEKVREMGLKLDPGNALYGGAAAAALLAGTGALAGLDTSPDKTLPARPENIAAAPPAGAAPDIDFDFLSDDAGAKPAATDMDLNIAKGGGIDVPVGGGDMMDLDFGATTPVRPGATDFNPLAASASHAAKPKESTQPVAGAGDMPDFDLGLGDAKATSSTMDFALDKPVAGAASDLDFDFTPPATAKTADVDMPLDLSALSLDLDAPLAATSPTPPGTASPTASAARRPEAQWQSAATKLDLARAYLEIGDKEGAKEILQEVLTLGNPEQQAAAKELTASLA